MDSQNYTIFKGVFYEILDPCHEVNPLQFDY